MALQAGTLIDISSMLDRFNAVVLNRTFNLNTGYVWHSTSYHLVYWTWLGKFRNASLYGGVNNEEARLFKAMNTDVLGPSTTPTIRGSDYNHLIGTLVKASEIIDFMKIYANYTTVWRRARSGLRVDYHNPDNAGYWHEDWIHLARFTDAYRTNFSYTTPSTGVITASGLESFFSYLASRSSESQGAAYTIDCRVCHASCHSNCHGSRGRR